MAQTEDGSRNSVLSQLVDSVRAISELPESRNAFRKPCANLVRRVKLLSPLFEELRDRHDGEAIGEAELRGFESLRVAMDSLTELLNSVIQGSKIHQAKFFFFLFLFHSRRKVEVFLESLFIS